MKSLLICHKGAPLDQVVLARWLAESTELVGIIELDETRTRVMKRVRREVRRVGWVRFFDVLAFRVWYRLFHAARDRAWEERTVAEYAKRLPALPANLPRLEIHSPNTAEAKAFIERLAPDFMVARCKQLLKREIFGIPRLGTYVMHPGVCPEYRNAHGCFWALANGDRDKVGMTLLKIDEGVDTGPVYGYFSYDIDEVAETHFVIQSRVVLDNLDRLAETFRAIDAGTAPTIDTRGRPSGTWGQPWLTRWLSWKRAARRRA
ncbi:MAG: formyltransferase family protein [Gemmatimonadota bacterium]